MREFALLNGAVDCSSVFVLLDGHVDLFEGDLCGVVDSSVDAGLYHCVYSFKDVVFGEVAALVGEALVGEVGEVDALILLLGFDQLVGLDRN